VDLVEDGLPEADTQAREQRPVTSGDLLEREACL
jgi:hypothetical protein